MLRWGSSTVAELAGTTSVRLDQTWRGLEMAQALNLAALTNDTVPASTELQSTNAPANTVLDSAADAAFGGVQSGPTLRHRASSDPGALPGASAIPHARHGLPGRQPHDVDKHTAVERSGSSIPMLASDVAHSGDVPQEMAHQILAQHESNSLQGCGHWAARPHPGPKQQHAEGLETGATGFASEPQDTRAAAAPTNRQLGGEQQQQPHSLMQRPSYRHNTKQPSHAQESPHVSSSQAVQVSQQAQVLRHRHRSRLKLDLGRHYKGIMSLNKRRSGKVSPENVALLPVRQASGVSAQQSRPDRAALIGSAHRGSAHHSSDLNHHPKLKTLGFVAMLPNKSKPGVTVLSAVPFAPGAAKRRHQSMQEVLHQTVQQVNVCTTWLQEQHTQQQQMQKALQVMTDTSVAMLDHAISAALYEQQHHAQ